MHVWMTRFGRQRISVRSRRRRLLVETLENRRVLAGIDMTNQEQLLLELINRARANPGAEATRYGIDLNQGLTAGTIVNSPKQPLAPNQALINAAGLHSQDMLDRDYFAHQGLDGRSPGDRMAAAGYLFSGWGENISLRTSSGALDSLAALYAHHEQLFKSPGHRTNILGGGYDELGNGVKLGLYNSANGSMVTENFGISRGLIFITGVAYTDQVTTDSFYTVGEGISGLTVVATSSTGNRFETQTGSSGGYSLSVPGGTYTVTFSGGSLPQPVSFTNIVVGSENRKVDLIPPIVTLQLTVSPSTMAENGGSSTATVTRSGSTTDSLLVTLASSDTTEATVPSTVTIPAGSASAAFTISAVDDVVADGNQAVTIAASSPGFSSATATLTVTDNDVAKLTVTINPNSISENGGTASGRVERDGSNAIALQVFLTTSDISEASVPSTVTIPAGATFATFAITAVDDTVLDGSQTVVIGASATGIAAGSTNLVVTDDEVPEPAKLTLTLTPNTIAENGGSAFARVERSGPLTSAIDVIIASGDTSEAAAPGTVTIAAGFNSATFLVNAVDDAVADGSQTVVITVTSTGLVAGSATLTVTDNEPPDSPKLIVTFNPTSMAENGGTSTARIERTGPTTSPAQVTLTSSDTTEATVPATATIPAGASFVTVTITAVDDTVVDGSQSVLINATSTGLTAGSASLTVTDNETPDTPKLMVTLSPASISENGGTSTARIERTGSTTSAVQVTLTSSDATEATVPATATISAGASFVNVTITAVDDTVVDGSQTVSIGASGTGLTAGSASLTVTDNETPDSPKLMVTLNPTSIAENGGTSIARVERTGSTASVVQVTLTSSDETEATLPASVTIPAGASSVDVTVTGVDDTLVDGSQSVVIGAASSGFTAGSASLTVTDNEVPLQPKLTITIDPASMSENGGTATARVERTGTTTAAVEVSLVSSDTTEATVPATIMIPAGASSATFTVVAVDDTIVDGSQTVVITASSTGLIAGTASITVTDNESPGLSLSFNPTSISEKDGRSTATLERSGSLTSALDVTLSSNDVSEATVPSTVTIPAGQSSVSFTVTAVDDTVFDGDVQVTINANAAGMPQATGRLTVTDNERADLSLNMDGLSYGERAGTVSGVLTRNGSTTSPLTVSLTSSNASALTVPATVTFAAGAQTVAIPMTIIDDSLADGPRTATIVASASGLAPAAATVTINDDDVAALTLRVSPATMSELGGTTVVTVTRNARLNSVLSVSLTSGDTTEAVVPAQITIPLGALSTTFLVTAVDDTVTDGDQRPLITAASSGFQAGTIQVVVQDNDVQALLVSLDSLSISERNGTTLGTVRRPTASSESLIVDLASNNPSAATVPASVIIPAGLTSATFVVTAVDDALLDGTQSTTITASAAGVASGSQSLSVSDWETLSVFLTNSSVAASAGSFSASVIRSNSDVSSPVTVQMSSSDPTALTVPSEVVIPAGETFATFLVTPAAGFRNPARTVTIAAANPAYQSVSGTVTLDDGLPRRWRNPLLALDVNADNHVTSFDALLVINYLNTSGAQALGTPDTEPTEYVDTSGDNFVSSIDALLIINELNVQMAGEGESKSVAQTDRIDDQAVDLVIDQLYSAEEPTTRRGRRR